MNFLPGTFLWKYKMCLGTCGFKEHFFARHFLWTFWKCLGKCGWKEIFLPGNFCMEILKVSGIVQMQRTLFSRHFLWKKSAWESAEVKNTETKLQRPCNSNKDHVICICLFHGNWTVQYHEQRQRLVCALYTYLQSLSIFVKLSDLLLLANLAKLSLFTHLMRK